MAQHDEHLLQVILRARDELTATALKAAKALDATGEAAKKVKNPANSASSAIGELHNILGRLPGVGGLAVNTLSEIGGKLGGLATPGGAAVAVMAAIVGGAALMAKTAANAGDEINRLSIQSGVSAENLSALKLAAELNDVSIGELTQSFKFLSTNLQDAVRGSGNAKTALDQLGFTNEQLRQGLVDPIAFLEEFAKRLFEIPNATQRMDAAVAVLGKSAATFLPLLQDLNERGMKGFMREAQRLGVVISSDFARQADEFNDNLTRIKTAGLGLALVLGKDLVEGVNAFMKALGLLEVSKTQQSIDAIATSISRATGQRNRTWLKSLLPEAIGGGDAALAEMQKYQDAIDALKKIQDQLANPEPTGTRTYNPPNEGAAKEAERQKKALEAVTKALTEQADSIEAQIIKLTEGEAASARYALQQAKIATELQLANDKIVITPAAAKAWDALRQKILETGDELRQTAFNEGPIKSLTKALYDQVNSAAESIISFKEGAAAAAKYAHGVKLVNLEVEAVKVGASLPPDLIAKLELYFQRLQALAKEERQLKFGERFKEISAELSAVFMTDRERDVAGIRMWGDKLRIELEKVVKDVPDLADGISALLTRIPQAMERQILDSSVVFTTLDGLAKGAFAGIEDSITGAIEKGETLNNVLRNFGNSITLGLSRAILQAAFKPLEEALQNVFRAIAKALGEGEGGGIWGTVAKFLTSFLTGAVTGSVGTAPTTSGGGPSLGADTSLPRISATTEYARGGLLGGSFTPLSSPAFRLSRVIAAYARGGITPGGFRPLSGFGEPTSDTHTASMLHLITHLTHMPTRAFAGGGVAAQPMFGLIGEGQFNEAVVPLPDNRSIPVKFQGDSPATRQMPNLKVEILGDVIPRQPTMNKADVVRIVVDDIAHDGPTRRAVLAHGR